MNIVIIGAGYVGLPLAIAFAKKYKVKCYDINKRRIEELKNGYDANLQHTSLEILKKNLFFTNNLGDLKKSPYYIITVPTPINLNYQPDLRILKKASKVVGQLISKNSIVIYESTTYPGCTEEVCIPILQKKSNLKFEQDFSVAYSPERINPGDKVNILKTITKIVGANDVETRLKVEKLYKSICKSIFVVDSIKIAESAKVIENIQRDINIALVNQLSILFNKLNIPTNEVLKAAATKWNFHYYKPGMVGGHCISVDPYYLTYKAKKIGFNPELILTGRKFNENMGKYISKEVLKLCKLNNISIRRQNIAVLGFSFKENIPDYRNTKVMQLVNVFRKLNLNIKIFDSIVNKNDVLRDHKIKIYNFKELKNFKYDVIILAVSHKEFLKKINFYNKFYKDKKNKIFIDIKNNYLVSDFKKNQYKYFQL
jgi:UDP-N-acetyl-D-galactosamine dehydrogenase